MTHLTMFSTKKFEILDEGLTLFEIANPQLFWELQHFLQSESHPYMAFGRDGKVLRPDKNILFIGDIGRTVDFNKLFSRQISNIVVNEMDDDQVSQLFEFDRKLREVVNDVIFQSNLPIDVSTDWDLNNLVKYLKPTLEVTNFRTAYDIIVTLIDIMQRLSDKRLLVFVNLTDYLTIDQIKELSKDLMHRQSAIVVIDKVDERDLRYQNIAEIKDAYIDNDFVEFENG